MGLFNWFMGLFKHNDPDINNWEHWDTKIIRYYLDPNFGDGMDGMFPLDIQTTVISAFDEWSRETGLTLVRTLFKEKAHIHVREKDLEGDRVGFGYFPAKGSMNRGMEFDTSKRCWHHSLLWRVALHEIGHCLGLMHVGRKKSIMYKKITTVDYIDSQSVRLVKKLYEGVKYEIQAG